MTYDTQIISIPQYEYSCTNQYGDRYKKKSSIQLSVGVLRCEVDSADDLKRLILLGHVLNTPVRYSFNTSPQTAYIKIVSEEKLREVI